MSIMKYRAQADLHECVECNAVLVTAGIKAASTDI